MVRLLTRHFFRRFLDNDLMSPEADQHETAILVCAALASTSLFVAVFSASKYLWGVPLPGPVAVISLDDKLLFVSASMVVTALVTLLEWNALALDVRDTAILGPLPIPRRAIVRAKLAALLCFGAGFAVAMNLIPSLVFPFLMLAKLPVSLLGLLKVMAAHSLTTMSAGLFGFLAVLGVRGLLQSALGETLFDRVSATVQGVLVVAMVSCLFLLPGLTSNVPRSWLASNEGWRQAAPPLWFLGLYEAAAGDVIVGARNLSLDPEAPRYALLIQQNTRATAIYNSHRGRFRVLATKAVVATVLAALVGLASYVWTMRRLPQPPRLRTHTRLAREAFVAVSQAIIVRHPVTQAGFFFTLQALFRSLPHRMSIAASGAVGLAAAISTVGGLDLSQSLSAVSPPKAILAVQFLIASLLLLGFRHAVRVPAELRANWMFQLAWSGDEGRYLAGVKRAAVIGLVLPALVALFPFQAFALGPRVASVHAACGLLAALTLLECLFWRCRKLSFASGYVPGGNLKTPLTPISVMLFAGVTYGFTALEQRALATPIGMAWFLLALSVLFALVKAVDLWQRRRGVPMTFDEPPELATQRLGLSGS